MSLNELDHNWLPVWSCASSLELASEQPEMAKMLQLNYSVGYPAWTFGVIARLSRNKAAAALDPRGHGRSADQSKSSKDAGWQESEPLGSE
jgi:hypothetical protein